MRKLVASYWQVFRLIFVIFFLYLMGDAFFRWDGFRYYAPFSEFLPSVALITILWSIVAALAALPVWLGGKAVEWLSHRLGWKVRMEHLLLFFFISIIIGAALWGGKRVLWQHTQTTLQLKMIVLSGMLFAAIFLTWLFRDRMAAIQVRLTPLVWLFGIMAVLSVPFVAYHTWGKQADNNVVQTLFAPAVNEAAEYERPNIILVIFDTLTARDMSVYGYYRPTTPFISKWAETASLFTKTEADSNFTSPTTATIMTGKRSWTHRAYHSEGSRPINNYTENLPLVLKRNGYFNMAFVVNPYASAEKLGISESFEIADPPIAFYSSSNSLLEIIWASLYRLFGDRIRLHDWIVKEDFIFYKFVHAISQDFSETIVPPKKAFKSFLEVLDNNKSRQPFFAWFQLLPPHAPYLPPAPYKGKFDPSPEHRTAKSQEKRRIVHDYTDEEQPDIDILRARYDEFIRYCDKQFEDFIGQLTGRGLLENTVIIFTSDHGESFEHNFVGHGLYPLYEQLTHIPLIIREPNQTEGRIMTDLTEQIDIAPTILDLAGIPAPLWMEGRSLLPLTRGERLPLRTGFSMNFQKNPSRWQQITKGTIAVWEGDYKLIHYLEENRSQLFNLNDDPGELNNLFDEEPETGRRLLSLIQENLKKANEKIAQGQ